MATADPFAVVRITLPLFSVFNHNMRDVRLVIEDPVDRVHCQWDEGSNNRRSILSLDLEVYGVKPESSSLPNNATLCAAEQGRRKQFSVGAAMVCARSAREFFYIH